MQTYPRATGLYDPRFEHDSCGVSFVAHMKGVRSNELVQTGLRALTNLEHRGATGAEADTGDGAGILLQVPDTLLRGRRRLRAAARRSLRRRHRLPARTTRCCARRRRPQIESIVVEEGLTVLGWRDAAGRPRRASARPPAPRCPRSGSCSSSSTRRRSPASTSTAHVRRPQARRARAVRRDGDLLRVAVGAHHRLQGHAHHAAARPVLRRPHRPADRERAAAGALAVLDEHVPVVAARPPVPVRRPQRRDQHGAGQPELDARPRGDGVAARTCPTSSGRSRSAPTARPTRPASTRCSSCCTSPAGRSSTPC